VKGVDLGKSQYIKQLQPQPTTSTDVEGDGPNIDILIAVLNSFGNLQK
jgi:hypothetical protein